MGNYLHKEFDAGPNDTIEVVLDRRANVIFLDPANYEHYRLGAAFRYFGGSAKETPMRFTPPRYGRWHVVVDLGGRSGTVRAGVQIYQGVNS